MTIEQNLCGQEHGWPPYSKPRESTASIGKAAVFVNDSKCTTNVANNVHFCLGEEEARAFYTAPKSKSGGGLGWSHHRFNQVAWRSIDAALASMPDRYGLWLSKQAAGWCAIRKQISPIQDLLDYKYPNCQSAVETLSNLNRCSDEGRTMLFEECVQSLEKWLHQDDRTEPKFFLHRGRTCFINMGLMSPTLLQAGVS